MLLQELKPEPLWHYFEEICRIPRPSKKEGKIAAYLMDFAQKQGLEARQDEAGNVLIKKPAVEGMEKAPIVVLQSHMDMVCEKMPIPVTISSATPFSPMWTENG